MCLKIGVQLLDYVAWEIDNSIEHNVLQFSVLSVQSNTVTGNNRKIVMDVLLAEAALHKI